MKSRAWQYSAILASVATVAAFLLIVAGCGDENGNGNGSQSFGRVDGAVFLPFELASALQPAAGVTVRLAGGDYTQNRVTGSDGLFAFSDVPVRNMTLTVLPAACLSDTQLTVTVVKDDTVTLAVTLRGDASGDCIPLPFAGASRMEINPSTNRAALLYDMAVRPKPALIVIDLTTGGVTASEFDDLTAVYDLAFLSSGVVVFNCFKTGQGYYLRFWNINTMTAHREDIFYSNVPVQVGGHIAVTPNALDVFVTHQTRSGFDFDGQVFCLSVITGTYNDADNSSLDGRFGFDSSLVGSSVNWPYGIALDAARSELLVSNYNDTVLVAIDLAYWGTFNRSANLIAPIPGVRKIPMSTGVAGYRPYLWGFAGGRGVAAHPSSGMLAYESGGTAPSASLTQAGLSLSSDRHHLAIHPDRGTWYTLVSNPDRPQSVRKSVEERSLTTLSLDRRLETRFLETPALDARAFAVNTATNKVYVAYANKAIVEIFQLQ